MEEVALELRLVAAKHFWSYKTGHPFPTWKSKV